MAARFAQLERLQSSRRLLPILLRFRCDAMVRQTGQATAVRRPERCRGDQPEPPIKFGNTARASKSRL